MHDGHGADPALQLTQQIGHGLVRDLAFLHLDQADDGHQVVLDAVVHFLQQHLFLGQLRPAHILGALALADVGDGAHVADDLVLRIHFRSGLAHHPDDRAVLALKTVIGEGWLP